MPVRPVASAVERLAARVGELAGHEVELERPRVAAHGDFATNAALQLAPERKRAPREIAEELVVSPDTVPLATVVAGAFGAVTKIVASSAKAATGVSQP